MTWFFVSTVYTDPLHLDFFRNLSFVFIFIMYLKTFRVITLYFSKRDPEV